MSLIRNLVRTYQGGLLLTTPMIFGTVAGDPPSNHVYMDTARMNGLGQASQPLISRAKLSEGVSFPSLGRAIFELFKKKKATSYLSGLNTTEWNSPDAGSPP